MPDDIEPGLSMQSLENAVEAIFTRLSDPETASTVNLKDMRRVIELGSVLIGIGRIAIERPSVNLGDLVGQMTLDEKARAA